MSRQAGKELSLRDYKFYAKLVPLCFTVSLSCSLDGATTQLLGRRPVCHAPTSGEEEEEEEETKRVSFLLPTLACFLLACLSCFMPFVFRFRFRFRFRFSLSLSLTGWGCYGILHDQNRFLRESHSVRSRENGRTGSEERSFFTIYRDTYDSKETVTCFLSFFLLFWDERLNEVKTSKKA